jgi:hypothetical protein
MADTPSRGQVDQAIREQLASDPEFRQRLLSDPKGTLSSVFGLEIPDEMEVYIHEETPSEIHITIPGSAELSEHDLEMVAGGVCWTNCPSDMGP